MLNHENVHALVRDIVGKLNKYLTYHPYCIVTEAQLREGYTQRYYGDEYIEKQCAYKHNLQCADGHYMAFKADVSYRNSLLTLERMVNIYNLREHLNKQLVGLSETKSEELASTIDNIHEQLIKGKFKNTQLSTKYAKVHISYHDGRLLNQNRFLSRWNATWMKSRANKAFEHALAVLDNFEKNFTTKGLPPPAYAP